MKPPLLMGSPNELGEFTFSKFYTDELDNDILVFEKRLNQSIVEFCEKYKIHLFIEQLSGKKEIELCAMIDNEKSIF